MDRAVAPPAALARDIFWESAGTSRIPFASYTSDELHRVELERFFYKNHWCYVGLEAEIPNPGDFKRTAVGERSVILVRDQDGAINVVENVCAHRGMSFCRERHGNKKDFTCPYHQWNYSLKGDLQGVPFRRGVKQDGVVQGGMPADFKPADNGLTKLKVAARGGVVFASFDHDVEPLEEFLGPTILRYFDRTFDGRELRLLGYNRQRIPGNWKLMQENIKDPYHPGLLHTWFVTFGLWRADNKSQLLMDARHRHAAMISTRGQMGASAQVTQVSSFRADMKLEDPRFLDIVPEAWWGGPTAVMTTIFPERDLPAAGQFGLDAPHPARRPRRVRLRLDPLRLRRRHARDDRAAAAPGQPVRAGRVRLGRRRRGDRAVAAGLRAEALPSHPGRARRHRRRRCRPHGDRDLDPRHVPLLARGNGSVIGAIDFAGYQALVQLYADYAHAVDSGNWDLWPEFFVDDCVYRLVPRENHERGLPLATLAFESKGMLKDRVYGIRETLFHDPYYQRHVVGAPLVHAQFGRADRERGQLRRLSHQAQRAEHGLQRRPLSRRDRRHAGGTEVPEPRRRLRQRDDPEFDHLSDLKNKKP